MICANKNESSFYLSFALILTRTFAQNFTYFIFIKNNWIVYYGFFETPDVGIIGIFVLLKYENDLELVTSSISLESGSPWQS